METRTPSVRSRYGADRRGRRHTLSLGEMQHYDHEVLDVARVVRVVKGGRRFRFRATVIVGDRAGRIGLGVGKSRDVQQAIQKAQDQASKRTVEIKRDDTTIPHVVTAKFGGTRVMLRPARRGSGIIAGGTIRTLADLAGIHDLVAKIHGSTNRINTIQAVLKALSSLHEAKRPRTGKAKKSAE